MGPAETLEYPYVQNFVYGDDREHSRDAASKCPHAQLLCQNVVDGSVFQIQITTNHYECQTSIRLHESPHFGHIFFRFEVQDLPERGSRSTISRPAKMLYST
jgi:hypothetical protein